jgi:hypothetical protein
MRAAGASHVADTAADGAAATTRTKAVALAVAAYLLLLPGGLFLLGDLVIPCNDIW